MKCDLARSPTTNFRDYLIPKFGWYNKKFMLVLNLKTIRTPHEHFEQVCQPGAIGTEFVGEEDAPAVVAPVELAFDIEKRKDEFHLDGRVRTTLLLRCSRCLEPFTWPVEAPFDLRYRPHTTPSGGDEREIEEEDFSSAFYQNKEIDLGQLIRERLYLSLPMKPLCREECRGLCPQCGTNLNDGTCDCRRQWEDPRFAALKPLRKGS